MSDLKPRFEIGQKVLHSRSGRMLQVLNRKFRHAVKTQAIKVGFNGATYIEDAILPDYWAYKLNDGRAYWYMEEVLTEAPTIRNAN